MCVHRFLMKILTNLYEDFIKDEYDVGNEYYKKNNTHDCMYTFSSAK